MNKPQLFTDDHPWFKENEITDELEIFDNRYFICKYKMLFGYRVYGGMIGDDGPDFTVCIGTNEINYRLVRHLYTLKIKLNIAQDKYPGQGLRHSSEIKPIHNDPEFMEWIGKLAEEAIAGKEK